MNMFRAFMELNELHEASSTRAELITKLKAAGKNYNFNKYTDAQLYRMVQRIQQPKVAKKEPVHELDLDFVSEPEYCECGARLSDAGFCHVCHDGLYEWKTSSGAQVNVNASTNNTSSASNAPTAGNQKKYVVTIIYDPTAKKLRGRADDGINGPAWVAFPSNLRDYDGQQYEVDQLIWNGKNYRVSGNIVEI
jgi:hypothetical protein